MPITDERLDLHRIEVVDESVAAILRSKTPAERIAMTADANRTVRLLIAGRLKTDNPDWTQEQIQREVVRRMTHAAN